MQFTFVFLYLFFYVLSLWLFLSTLIIFMPSAFYTKYSLNYIFSFSKTYTNWSFLIYLGFFLLSGLPPVGLFFVKLNFIIYILNYFYGLFFIYLFIFFFFNMLYYLYIFKFKISWFSSTKFLVSNFLRESIKTHKSPRNNNLTGFKKIASGTPNFLYNFLFIAYTLIFFLLFNIFFFLDTFIIFYNFFLFW